MSTQTASTHRVAPQLDLAAVAGLVPGFVEGVGSAHAALPAVDEAVLDLPEGLGTGVLPTLQAESAVDGAASHELPAQTVTAPGVLLAQASNQDAPGAILLDDDDDDDEYGDEEDDEGGVPWWAALGLLALGGGGTPPSNPSIVSLGGLAYDYGTVGDSTVITLGRVGKIPLSGNDISPPGDTTVFSFGGSATSGPARSMSLTFTLDNTGYPTTNLSGGLALVVTYGGSTFLASAPLDISRAELEAAGGFKNELTAAFQSLATQIAAQLPSVDDPAPVVVVGSQSLAISVAGFTVQILKLDNNVANGNVLNSVYVSAEFDFNLFTLDGAPVPLPNGEFRIGTDFFAAGTKIGLIDQQEYLLATYDEYFILVRSISPVAPDGIDGADAVELLVMDPMGGLGYLQLTGTLTSYGQLFVNGDAGVTYAVMPV